MSYTSKTVHKDREKDLRMAAGVEQHVAVAVPQSMRNRGDAWVFRPSPCGLRRRPQAEG